MATSSINLFIKCNLEVYVKNALENSVYLFINEFELNNI
jgi:hypothetical protein